jgi:Ca2+-binding EF-hand superfamily protein
MKRTLLTLAALAVSAVAISTACAEDGDKGKDKGKRNPENLFKKLDANGDGKVSKEEFAKMAERAGGKGKGGKGGDKLFGRLDGDNDGFISKDEFKKMSEMRGKKKKDK